MTEVYRAAWVIAYRELLRFFQDRARLMSSFAMPLLFLVIFGAGFNRIVGSMATGIDFIKFMFPGVIAMSVAMTSVFSGLSVVWDREFGFLREVMVAPLNRGGVVLGKAMGTAAVAVGQGLMMLVLAPVVGLKLSPFIVLMLIPLMLLLSLALGGLGIFVATRMRSQQGFQVVMQVLVFPLIFLSGVFFPVNSVPAWLQVVAKVNPVTYGVDAIRQVFLGTGAAGASLGVTVFGHTMSVLEEALAVAVVGAVLLGAASWSFSRQE